VKQEEKFYACSFHARAEAIVARPTAAKDLLSQPHRPGKTVSNRLGPRKYLFKVAI
jgi:hypothetical protein